MVVIQRKRDGWFLRSWLNQNNPAWCEEIENAKEIDFYDATILFREWHYKSKQLKFLYIK